MNKRIREKLEKRAYGGHGYLSTRQKARYLDMRGTPERARLESKFAQGVMGARRLLGNPWVLPSYMYDHIDEQGEFRHRLAGHTKWNPHRVWYRTVSARVVQRTLEGDRSLCGIPAYGIR